MDLQKMITELEAERDRLDQAILALERLSDGTQKRRGRPPKWLKNGKPSELDALIEAEATEVSSVPGEV